MNKCHGLTRTTREGSKGYTLIEAMIAVAIVAILSAIAVPSFAAIQENAAKRAALNNFWHAIFLARSEAVKRNSVVSICKSSSGQTCDSAAAEWSGGWIVFENRDHNEPATREADEPVLQVYAGWPTGHITSNRKAFSFRPTTQGAVNGTIVFCGANGHDARAIIISHTGRPRQSSRDADNKPLQCTS